LIEEIVEPHRLVDVPIEVATGPAQAKDGTPEPVTERNPGVLYGLGNLVENAADFATSKVQVEARWSGDEVRITIADDGTGFPPHVLEQLGEPFVTTRAAPGDGQDETDEHTGMGLGFFIAKTLLERSGATIALANRQAPEGGAVVTVVWPRVRFEHAAEAARPRPVA
jgi:two-component system sensor histidine kinase RegB